MSADPAPKAGAGQPMLEVASLTKHYGKVAALEDLNLTVGAGQIYGFLGRNGAGKSTTIRIIMGITRPTSGTLRMFGREVGFRDPAPRRHIGYVAQEQHFYGWMKPLQLGHFVSGFYPTWDQAEFERLLTKLEVPIDRKVRTFSGGMVAKLALCLALAHRPPLLLLDEPTAGMDAVARREFIEIVRQQARLDGRTTFFSSHLIDEVELAADTVGIIDGGRMLYEGPLDQLRASARRLRGPVGADEEPWREELAQLGVRVLQDRVTDGQRELYVQGSPQVMAAGLPLPAGFVVQAPSLEDIFVAMVTTASL